VRVTINGSGAIVTHGDSLSGGGVIEFPINEPPEFARTLTAYTVTGSAPSRKLRYQGHEIAVESPTATAERAPDTASGGVTVTDGTTSVAASTVQAGVVTDGGSGTAIAGTCVISDTDPGAIGAGNLWLDSAAQTEGIYPLFVRDPSNAFWLQASIGDTLSTDGIPSTSWGVVDGSGNQLRFITVGTNAITIDIDSAGGTAPRSSLGLRKTQFNVTHEESGGSTAGVLGDATGLTLTGDIGFFAHAPSARPEVPASPTVQDVVDALVALGLITQAA
jgi:hypothetical protein